MTSAEKFDHRNMVVDQRSRAWLDWIKLGLTTRFSSSKITFRFIRRLRSLRWSSHQSSVVIGLDHSNLIMNRRFQIGIDWHALAPIERLWSLKWSRRREKVNQLRCLWRWPVLKGLTITLTSGQAMTIHFAWRSSQDAYFRFRFTLFSLHSAAWPQIWRQLESSGHSGAQKVNQFTRDPPFGAN